MKEKLNSKKGKTLSKYTQLRDIGNITGKSGFEVEGLKGGSIPMENAIALIEAKL